MLELHDHHQDDALSIGERNAVLSDELIAASGDVIAKRLAIGLSGMIDPANADHAELARLVPEKSAAVSAGATALFERSGQFVERMARFTTDEVLLASRACASLTACRTPAAFLAAQHGLTFAWLARAISQAMNLGGLAMQSPGDAMAPFHRTATANARRLAAPDPGIDVAVARAQ